MPRRERDIHTGTEVAAAPLVTPAVAGVVEEPRRAGEVVPGKRDVALGRLIAEVDDDELARGAAPAPGDELRPRVVAVPPPRSARATRPRGRRRRRGMPVGARRTTAAPCRPAPRVGGRERREGAPSGRRAAPRGRVARRSGSASRRRPRAPSPPGKLLRRAARRGSRRTERGAAGTRGRRRGARVPPRRPRGRDDRRAACRSSSRSPVAGASTPCPSTPRR